MMQEINWLEELFLSIDMQGLFGDLFLGGIEIGG
jgi:hypothetical protein